MQNKQPINFTIHNLGAGEIWGLFCILLHQTAPKFHHSQSKGCLKKKNANSPFTIYGLFAFFFIQHPINCEWWNLGTPLQWLVGQRSVQSLSKPCSLPVKFPAKYRFCPIKYNVCLRYVEFLLSNSEYPGRRLDSEIHYLSRLCLTQHWHKSRIFHWTMFRQILDVDNY